MSENGFELRLQNAGGIPIVRLGGTVSRNALNALRFTIDRLAKAGHYNIVLNIEKAQATSWDFLTGLTDAVNSVRRHYGAVDLVARADRLQQLLGIEKIARMFRLNDSEGKAICRIKRLTRPPDTLQQTSARIVDNL